MQWQFGVSFEIKKKYVKDKMADAELEGKIFLSYLINGIIVGLFFIVAIGDKDFVFMGIIVFGIGGPILGYFLFSIWKWGAQRSGGGPGSKCGAIMGSFVFLIPATLISIRLFETGGDFISRSPSALSPSWEKNEENAAVMADFDEQCPHCGLHFYGTKYRVCPHCRNEVSPTRPADP